MDIVDRFMEIQVQPVFDAAKGISPESTRTERRLAMGRLLSRASDAELRRIAECMAEPPWGRDVQEELVRLRAFRAEYATRQ